MSIKVLTRAQRCLIKNKMESIDSLLNRVILQFRKLNIICILSVLIISKIGVRNWHSLYDFFPSRKPFAFMAVACVRMKVKYYRVSRLVVLPDYQGIGVGKRLLNFIAELYSSQTHLPFYLVTSNPQLIRSNLDCWKIKRIGHGSHGREDTRINRELVKSNSRRRLSVSMTYHPSEKSEVGCVVC